MNENNSKETEVLRLLLSEILVEEEEGNDVELSGNLSEEEEEYYRRYYRKPVRRNYEHLDEVEREYNGRVSEY